ncbi:Os06g0246400, partial [Oryza sativa Japonica Group]
VFFGEKILILFLFDEIINADEFIPEPHLRCDFSDNKSDVYEMEGAIRILSRELEVFLVAPRLASISGRSGVNTTGLDANATRWKIQPYTHKGESRVMPSITEVTLRLVTVDEAPPCDEWHDVPVIVYSNGGYCSN